LAIEHNCKYLSILAEQAHNERVIAVRNEIVTRKEIENMQADYDKMKTQNKAL
jgi:hypothetical protein